MYSVCMYVYMYIYIYMCVYIYIYIYDSCGRVGLGEKTAATMIHMGTYL